MKYELKEAVTLFENNKIENAKKICLNIYNSDPNNFDNLRLLNFIYYREKNFSKALEVINKVIKINPNFAEAYNEKGGALNELKKLESSIKCYDQAIKINPSYAHAYYNKGVVLQSLRKLESAIESYDQAIKIIPNFFQAHNNKAFALRKLNRLDDSIKSYYKAFEIGPDNDFLLGELIHAKNKICDWKNFNEDLNILKKKIIEKKKTTTPFPILHLYDSPMLQKISAEIWNKDKFKNNNKFNNKNIKLEKKIRIGYYSSDFYNHAMSYLLAGLFEFHNKSKFEIIAFSFSPKKNDEMSKRIYKSFDQIIDINLKTDKEVAEISRKLKIDIAVDLLGFTANNRMGIFAEKCAPIQINYLGYPGTSGSKFIDYIVADKTIIQKKNRKFYSEKIIYLPNTYQPRDSKQKISKNEITKESFGLPKKSFVFCCFNQNYKITPDIFNIWMRLLNKVNNSVLWLLKDHQSTLINLKKEAEKRGINPERIIFAERMNQPDHLARHRIADLFIDTFPYTAHTTCSDALWSDLPVVTYAGQSFASRVSASILNAIGLKELITTTEKEYEDLIFKLATNQKILKNIKNKLTKNKITKPLFNSKLYTKKIESAYIQIYRKYQSKLPTKHIEIK